jgi:uncharacterized membrane protein YpjA
MLHALFWINLLGTIYGYYWYSGQMIELASEKPWWMLILVPDSPTGSLLFTLALLYLLIDAYSDKPLGGDKKKTRLRVIIEGMACAASFKYGVWAVAIIVTDNLLGSQTDWIDFMLSASHLGMAAEALLFARFFQLNRLALAAGACWIFASDLVDYGYGVYPSLSSIMVEHISIVAVATYALSAVTILLFAWIARRTRLPREQGVNR